MTYHIRWKSVITGFEEEAEKELDFDTARKICDKANSDWEGMFFHWPVPVMNPKVLIS